MDKDILLEVQRPARYIGREINAIKKDLTRQKVKVALCFPDIYEIGMSHLGLKMLYHILNSLPDVACERAFLPWIDMEQKIKKGQFRFLSLESQLPLKSFDIIGISLQYELNFTDALMILELSELPLRASQREGDLPLVIAGGVCCINPEPMYEFFDLFLIGEAEEAIVEIIQVYKRYRLKKSFEKERLLLELAQIEGVYVPSLYKSGTVASSRIEIPQPRFDSVSPTINKRAVSNLDEAPHPTKIVLPYVEIVHDRISVEIMRGCPHRCRFCQAWSAYWPLRLRSPDEIVRLAKESFGNTGYESLSLVSLSSGDYPDLDRVISELVGYFKERGVSISLPSLRPKDKLKFIPQQLSRSKKTGLTFAPEAGSQRLREIIAKDIEIDIFLDCLKECYRAGWRRVKLYFMIGLPTEGKQDLDAIVELVHRTSSARKNIGTGPAEVVASLSCFIPKAHTPFQWLPMEKTESLQQKRNYLLSKLKGSYLKRYIRFKFHDFKMGFIEGVISKGDRRLSGVILKAYKLGCRFDAWKDTFKFDLWMEAFQDCGIDPRCYIYEPRDLNQRLPWSHISTGVQTESLKDELRKALTPEELYSILKVRT